MKEIQDLIALSREYGNDPRFVIAGGGNTSYKNADKLWVKASGSALSSISEDGFAILDRSKLDQMAQKQYSTDANQREAEVKNDLADACITKDRRPSVETSLHNAIDGAFVVHLHPTSVNALMCSQHAREELARLFGDRALYIPYTDPGFVLFKAVESGIQDYQARFGKQPEFVFLQNHGIFVGADDIETIRQRYRDVQDILMQDRLAKGFPEPEDTNFAPSPLLKEILPALRMLLSGEAIRTAPLKVLHCTRNAYVDYFTQDAAHFQKIARPFSPDSIVYCKSNYIYIQDWDATDLLPQLQSRCTAFEKEFGYTVKVILVKGLGMIAVGDHFAQCRIVTDVFMDMMKIAYGAQAFGGEHPMTQAQIDFIDHWEVEQYRRKQSQTATFGRVENLTFIITGAAQGFGAGIAECLLQQGANVVVADINAQQGEQTVVALNQSLKSNRALFVQTDVSSMNSLAHLMDQTVSAFGGVDVYINNAGVIKAGGIEEMTPEHFEFVTKINYNAYFYGVKQATPILKLQAKYAPHRYFDIIQINSKSGLRGSKANFAYAGGKFGGIGLTQSFALELAPYRIKVNAICPGNFYDGPLWSDPEKGLFVQYLNAGKVPGAKTVEDVKAFYLAQSPMNKGCAPADVVKAIYYVIEQTCETGQALPVSGGQVMLN